MKQEIQEATTISREDPQQVIRTRKIVQPLVTEQHPQKVYEKKKAIFRSSQVIWYIIGLTQMLLAFRVCLKAVGANPFVGFTNFIYAITQPLVAPFQGIVSPTISENSVIEWSTVIASFVYMCISWSLVYLLDLLYPITPEDVEGGSR